jgi:hypothetical protein
MSAERPKAISKRLSANDVGTTGAHMAGILVPKKDNTLQFFPSLVSSEKNPRVPLVFRDSGGGRWVFNFIYYNNALFGGTRNEYRLTGMTRFIRQNNLAEGDEVVLRRRDDATLTVDVRRTSRAARGGGDVLRLGTSWRVINL